MCSGLKACSVQKNHVWVKYVIVAPGSFLGNPKRQQLPPVPFCGRTVLSRTARNTFCIFHCTLLLDCTSATKVTQIFSEETVGGQQDSCRDFPSPALLCKILSTGSLLTGPQGMVSPRSALLAQRVFAPSAALPHFTVLTAAGD